MWKEVAVIGWVFHLQLSWHCGLEVDEAKSALEMISYQGNPILRAKIYADDHSVHCTVNQDARTTSTLATFIASAWITASLWYSLSAIGEAMSSYEYQAYRVHFNTSGIWIQCIVIQLYTLVHLEWFFRTYLRRLEKWDRQESVRWLLHRSVSPQAWRYVWNNLRLAVVGAQRHRHATAMWQTADEEFEDLESRLGQIHRLMETGWHGMAGWRADVYKVVPPS